MKIAKILYISLRLLKIKNLKIFAHHGVYELENEQGQNFIVNAVLYTDIEKAGKSDSIEDAVDYGAVCLFIDAYMRENRFDLLEAAASHTAQELLLEFPAVKKVELEIEKPDAPIPLRFESVSVRVTKSWHSVAREPTPPCVTFGRGSPTKVWEDFTVGKVVCHVCH